MRPRAALRLSNGVRPLLLLSQERRTNVRKLVTNAILCTDMAKHFEVTQKMDALNG